MKNLPHKWWHDYFISVLASEFTVISLLPAADEPAAIRESKLNSLL